MKLKHWILFILLGVIWSASFLWIKIALEEIRPLTLVTYRVGFGLLTGLIVAAVFRIRIPRDWKTWRVFFILGILNVAIPFFLITWGEQTIELGSGFGLECYSAALYDCDCALLSAR